jgi:hypothetical protein
MAVVEAAADAAALAAKEEDPLLRDAAGASSWMRCVKVAISCSRSSLRSTLLLLLLLLLLAGGGERLGRFGRWDDLVLILSLALQPPQLRSSKAATKLTNLCNSNGILCW